MDAVIAGGNGKTAAQDLKRSVGMDAVSLGCQGHVHIPKRNTVLSLHGAVHRVDGVSAAGQDKVVLAADAVGVVSIHAQAAGAVDGQVALGKHAGVWLILPLLQRVGYAV